MGSAYRRTLVSIVLAIQPIGDGVHDQSPLSLFILPLPPALAAMQGNETAKVTIVREVGAKPVGGRLPVRMLNILPDQRDFIDDPRKLAPLWRWAAGTQNRVAISLAAVALGDVFGFERGKVLLDREKVRIRVPDMHRSGNLAFPDQGFGEGIGNGFCAAARQEAQTVIAIARTAEDLKQFAIAFAGDADLKRAHGSSAACLGGPCSRSVCTK
jgi:hypothetical protein